MLSYDDWVISAHQCMTSDGHIHALIMQCQYSTLRVRQLLLPTHMNLIKTCMTGQLWTNVNKLKNLLSPKTANIYIPQIHTIPRHMHNGILARSWSNIYRKYPELPRLNSLKDGSKIAPFKWQPWPSCKRGYPSCSWSWFTHSFTQPTETSWDDPCQCSGQEPNKYYW